MIMEYSERQRDKVEKQPLYRELAVRKRDGLETILLWLKRSNTVWIHIIDDRDSVDKTFQVPNEEALEAFYHPYAYAHLGELASKQLTIYEGDDGA